MALPLLGAGIVAAAYGLLIALRNAGTLTDHAVPRGRAFNPRVAILFALTIGGMLLLAAVLTDALGQVGLGMAAALAGFADAHSAAAAVASMHSAGKITAAQAVLPILTGFTTNAASKIAAAAIAGDRAFVWQVAPGIVLSVGAAWAGALASGLQA
jgi:uncharacterized membrane protein (DUF4010 family)